MADTEREAFEVWALNASGKFAWLRFIDARYVNIEAQALWEGWQARALASRPAEVDDWISVLDQMPEPGQQVIAYRPTAELTQDSTVRIVRYLGAGRELESWQGVRHGFDCICHPTHWKPIPGAPSHTTNKEK